MKTHRSTAHYDVIVVGGGLVGSAVAYGIARQGAHVLVVDEGDDAFGASVGNFGLVWVQGKGIGLPAYTTWTRESARLWPAFADELRDETGVDAQLLQPGGFDLCFSDEELQERGRQLLQLSGDADGDYPFEVLDAVDLRARIPEIGASIAGATYTPMDGHVNPLKLLLGLRRGLVNRKAHFATSERVVRIDSQSGGFVVHGQRERWCSARVVLAAGLGNKDLAPMVGLQAPVVPIRGQVLISERVASFLRFPTVTVRQTNEGTVQLGDSLENVGFDNGVTTDVLAEIAMRGVKAFPLLRDVRLVRAWGALRVMTPDGFPIYEESSACPGAFNISCHSGVTLAAAHALRLAGWITGAREAPVLHAFAADRFRKPYETFSHVD
ncbi:MULTISPECIES: NAD(P)/FAD-dependent oxidoreductase [unclassified Burkholderia]|uniref:NAD(P)/FAD-dependent oxidoreductase n=1 Tax=unclassified Burkholderia TaxID=2613784 RepID=UPI000F56D611|nr:MULTISPECIES: FAD-dependent oxidoreductase [unclassified Burkholderia]RQR69846.1 FAD-binding oxidoreductase [Burkholderia sp. Bp9012]RQR73339.1 FAD-binding oxidoreductase [Burkholderia sp. Bp9011]RQR85198.1 FAD-binding oxidoreductase [Burkholderia sp. Bp9010]RQZ40323.1 FAD-binding oxidoreductase [Burkholderia sp. Bp9099]